MSEPGDLEQNSETEELLVSNSKLVINTSFSNDSNMSSVKPLIVSRFNPLNQNNYTANISGLTVEMNSVTSVQNDLVKLGNMLSSAARMASESKNKSCENVIRYDGFEYVCYEKINFIVVMALILFALFIIFTIGGNLLVILAILRDRRLRTPSTYLILSLAFTDLIVGLVTVPIRAFSEIKDYGTWPYGALSCDIRVVIDKICVYASLLHLVAIALDRYLTVSSLRYSLTRSGKQIFYMVSVVWLLSIALAAAPMFGWRDKEFDKRIAQGSCFVNTLFSLNLTVWLVIFVIPVLSILILYYRIYLVVKNRMKNGTTATGRPTESKMSAELSTQLSQASHNHSTSARSNGNQNDFALQQQPSVKFQSGQRQRGSNSFSSSTPSNSGVKEDQPFKTPLEMSMPDDPQSDQAKRLAEQRSRREHKAANTLVLITICVIVCWFPFYTMYTISSIFGLKFASTSNFYFKLSIFLGYFNSLANPAIYAIANPFYRDAFKRLLFF